VIFAALTAGEVVIAIVAIALLLVVAGGEDA
jgi:hypothetical protein